MPKVIHLGNGIFLFARCTSQPYSPRIKNLKNSYNSWLVDSIDPAPNSSTLLINYEKPPHNTYTKVISRPNKQPKTTTTTPQLALLPLAKLSEMAMERERES
jgi:hypothetical protein